MAAHKARRTRLVTPTQRSLKHLRDLGYLAGVVERWNPHSRTRHDLFGVLDLVAVGNGETIGVQTTSASNVSARVKKITDSDALPELRASGWRLVVHGWRKSAAGRWVLREVDVS